jgi:hypothetical protein
LNRNSILTVCAALVGAVIILSNVQTSDSVLTYQMLVTVQPEKSPIMEGDFPVIIGTVKDEAYKPVADATILILFGSEAVTTTTDDQGNYRYQSAIPATPGTYEIDVTATKGGYYLQGQASSTYEVDSFQTMTNDTTNTATPFQAINGLPVQAGNYTVYLGKVTQWNLETTCFVSFGDQYIRFLKTCDLYNIAGPASFTADSQTFPPITVIQYNNDTYRLFPQSVYNSAYFMANGTLDTFVADTWANSTSTK